MSSNTFGRIFRLTSYGESHGAGLGGIVEGCPAGLPLDEKDLQAALDLRRPGPDGRGGLAGSARCEKDRVKILSGLFEGRTTGTPIAFHVDNTDQRASDYEPLADLLRPGHADLGFLVKYGRRDHRGGGRASGRETVSRVAGGAIAEKLLASCGVRLLAYTLAFGGLAAKIVDPVGARDRAWFSPDPDAVPGWDALALSAGNEMDSLGGLVRIEIHGLPAGLGEPVFDKLDARLAYAMMGVGAVKGVEIGNGFDAALARGSDNNDPILPGAPDEKGLPGGALPSGAAFSFASNRAGGVLGGLSTGAPVLVTCAVKPVASIGIEQRTINAAGKAAMVNVGGRHDVSAIPRIVPVLKAMAALTAADFMLLQRCAVV
ncbi:chorismate synthase [Desulfovibrio sp. OttesenSCG-928-F20]|nr:chorismate synthase [Desulfovibrio sp. OttesenSCG-928-M16]MDL2291008.1 chorismate synthase [Desulfovibrio sp. OttesenSCG-928-F20]